MKKLSLIIVALLMSFMISGCSDDPGKVIVSYYTAVDAGKLDEAMACLSKNSRQMLELAGGKTALPNIVDELKKKKGIKDISITKQNVTGDRALVVYSFTFTDDTKLDSQGFLVKESGAWRIVLK